MKQFALLLLFIASLHVNAQILDPAFGDNGEANLTNFIPGAGIEVLPNGKILIVGTHDSVPVVNGNYVRSVKTVAVACLNADGTLDNSFGINGFAAVDTDTLLYPVTIADYKTTGHGLFVQPDGKILVVGTMQGTVAGIWGFALRLNPNGTLDTLFGYNGATKLFSNTYYGLWEAYCVRMLGSGKIVCGGKPAMGLGVVQLTNNGLLDATFGNGGVADSTGMHIEPHEIAFLLEAGHRILAVGGMDYYPLSLYSIQNNGIIDTVNYHNGPVDNAELVVGSVTMTDDYGLYVGGQSYQSKGIVYKYTSNGDADNAFGTNGYYKSTNNAYYTNINIQPDGKLLLSGSQRISSNTRYIIQRLTAQGQKDNSFGTNGYYESTLPPSGVTNYAPKATTSIIQPDGKVLVAGTFRPIIQQPGNGHIERFSLSAVNSIADNNASALIIYPNPVTAGATIHLNLTTNNGVIRVIDMAGKTVLQTNNVNTIAAPPISGLYLIQIVTDEGISTQRIVVE